MCELTYLYSFTGLKVIQNNTQIEQESIVNDDNHHRQSQKENTIHKSIKTPDPNKSEKERKKYEIDRKNLTTRTKRKIRT